MNKRMLLRAVIYANIAGALLFLGVIAYLALFTRYMSDDYCETIMVQADSPVMAVVHRYEEGKWRAANRYSNLLFVGIVEKFGTHNIQFVPIIMLVLWVFGLIWLMREIQALAGIRWHFLVPVFLGISMAFFTVLEAPNRFQIFYWRSSMATHFVPLVFLVFLIAAVLRLVRAEKPIPLWISAAFFFSAFMIGGFSEPPNTVMVTGFGLALIAVWILVKNGMRRPALNLLVSIFSGAVVSLLVMAASPAVSRVNEEAPSFFEWVYRTTQYTYLFIINIFKSLPIPIALSILISALFFYILYSPGEHDLAADRDQNIAPYLAVVAPLLSVILIAASFSPSAYGQSYPVERSRILAHVLVVTTCMLEGSLLGIWAARRAFLRSPIFTTAATLTLLLCSIYSFRAGIQTLRQNEPEYRERAALWDTREARIIEMKARGETDLTVVQYDGVYGTKELDTYETHWVNKCAAQYYGVNSIRAIPEK